MNHEKFWILSPDTATVEINGQSIECRIQTKGRWSRVIIPLTPVLEPTINVEVLVFGSYGVAGALKLVT